MLALAGRRFFLSCGLDTASKMLRDYALEYWITDSEMVERIRGCLPVAAHGHYTALLAELRIAWIK